MYLLIVSVLTDLVALLGPYNRAAQMISLGTFAAASLAGIALWSLYLLLLDDDFDGWRRSFRTALRVPRRTLAGRARRGSL